MTQGRTYGNMGVERIGSSEILTTGRRVNHRNPQESLLA